jgi:hypothetical protein
MSGRRRSSDRSGRPLGNLYAPASECASNLDALDAQSAASLIRERPMVDLIYCALGLGLFAGFGLYARLLRSL